MDAFDITASNKGIPLKDIRNEIAKNSGKIVIDYPMLSINSSNSYIDIIDNYIEASYIAEELGKYATSIKAEEISQYLPSPICRLEIEVKERKPFIATLRQLSIALSDAQEDEDILQKHQENLSVYEDSLDNRLFLCPDLVDNYYANLVGVADFEIESEYGEGFLESEYEKYPERKYGFWKSAYSKTIGEDFYVSRECWVVPSIIDIQRVLSVYSASSSTDIYDEAILFSLENVSYLAHEYGLTYFPSDQFLHAKNFVTEVLRKSGSDKLMSENTLTYLSAIGDFEKHYDIDRFVKIYPEKYLLSHSSLSIIVETDHFRYVFFPEQIKSNKITALYNKMSTVYGFIGEFAGVTKSVTLSWENFDDEKFENLCYDIIYHHPKFDNQTIRKMGKSRSRDGGRDIVVYTKKRPSYPSRMYIFQCKFTKTGSSLITQKIENISDTVVQYNAQGYGVMAPVVIDATLYDRIDAICNKFKIKNYNWSILEIERFLARHPNLKERHFKS